MIFCTAIIDMDEGFSGVIAVQGKQVNMLHMLVRGFWSRMACSSMFLQDSGLHTMSMVVLQGMIAVDG